MEMPPERLAEIGRMLKQRVTVEEAIAIMASNAQEIRELAAGMQPGDELWLYDSDPEDWAHLCGEMGFAVVRGGRVATFEMFLMN